MFHGESQHVWFNAQVCFVVKFEENLPFPRKVEFMFLDHSKIICLPRKKGGLSFDRPKLIINSAQAEYLWKRENLPTENVYALKRYQCLACGLTVAVNTPMWPTGENPLCVGALEDPDDAFFNRGLGCFFYEVFYCQVQYNCNMLLVAIYMLVIIKCVLLV